MLAVGKVEFEILTLFILAVFIGFLVFLILFPLLVFLIAILGLIFLLLLLFFGFLHQGDFLFGGIEIIPRLAVKRHHDDVTLIAPGTLTLHAILACINAPLPPSNQSTVLTARRSLSLKTARRFA